MTGGNDHIWHLASKETRIQVEGRVIAPMEMGLLHKVSHPIYWRIRKRFMDDVLVPTSGQAGD